MESEWLIQQIADCPFVSVALPTGLSSPLLCGHFVQIGRLRVECIVEGGCSSTNQQNTQVELEPFLAIILGLITTKPMNFSASLPEHWHYVPRGQIFTGH
jgi:hypothetical protein